jgi:hypothetical protein
VEPVVNFPGGYTPGDPDRWQSASVLRRMVRYLSGKPRGACCPLDTCLHIDEFGGQDVILLYLE